MQSLFPVLLDGNTNAARLDSFGSRSRKMEDYLLGEKDVSDRNEGIGYLYLELKRSNREEYLTVGIGLSARRGSRLTKWYFAIEDNSRMGQDFQLYDRVGSDEIRPFTQMVLKNRIEGKGKLFKARKDYKHYINQHVFGFATLQQFDELVELLINLRSPKLSRDFRPTVIYEILKNSLPKLKDEELLTLSQTIERLDRHRERIQEIKNEMKDLKGFIRQYRVWHTELVGQISTKWLELSASKAQLEKQLTELQKELTLLEEQTKENQLEQSTNQTRQQVVEKTISDLANHEGFDLVRREEELHNDLQILKQNSHQLYEKIREKQRHLNELRGQIEALEGNLYTTNKEMQDYLSDNEQYLDSLRLHNLHENYHQKIQTAITEQEFRYWQKQVSEKKSHFAEVMKYLDELALLLAQIKENQRVLGDLQKELDEFQRDSDHWQQVRQDEIEKWKALFNDWHQQAHFSLATEEFSQTLFLIDKLYEEELPISEVLVPVTKAYQRALRENQRTRIPMEQKKDDLLEAKKRLEQEIKEWQERKAPVPERSTARELNRQQLKKGDAIAFYESVDFLTKVNEEERNHIEGALAASGIMDALISEKSLVLSDDVQILSNPQFYTETLENYLVANDELSPALKAIVTDILQSILVGDSSEAVPSIMLDGSYQIANMTGKMAADYQASFIGVASQERFRQLKIKALQEKIIEIDTEIAELSEKIERNRQLQQQIAMDFDELPKSTDIYEAIHQLQSLQRRVADKKVEFEKKTQQLQGLSDQSLQKRIEIQDMTKDDGLALTKEAFEEAQLAAENYGANLNDAYLLYRQIQSDKEKMAIQNNMLGNLEDDEADYRERLDEVQQNQEKTEQLLQENRKQQQLVNIEEIKETLSSAYREQEELRRGLRQLENDSRKLFENQTRAESNKETIEGQFVTVNEAESLWQQLLSKESNRYEVSDLPLGDIAKSAAKEINVKYLKELENRFSSSFNYLADQLISYQPRLLSETSVELTEEQKRTFGELENYNNQILPRFEAESQNQSAFSLLKILESQQMTMQDLLKQEDEELFKKIIMDSVGNILRQRIANAQTWVEKMNQLLINQKNSSGLSLSIHWKELPATSERELGTRELVQLLQKPVEILSEIDKNAIVGHFQEKIQFAQEQLREDEDQTGILFQAVAQVLDYREWFVFELRFKRSNKGYQWKPLTDHQFYIFSGGEKAVAMYLPLFAAVYSRYQDANPDCPQIITLDEAFAGIDDANIGELFKACEQLNFNYMMNSQALYGEYPAVSSLMTYQLLRPLNANIVSVVQYHWNGKVKKLITEE